MHRGNSDVIARWHWKPCVATDGRALEAAAMMFRCDRQVVLEAVRYWGRVLKYAADDLRDDKGLVSSAVTSEGVALEFASEELHGNRDIAMAAVENNGEALQFATEELQGDEEVVGIAVANGEALQYASAELRRSKTIVKLAVSRCGEELRFAAATLRCDHDIVLAAARNDGSALRYVADQDRLFADLNFVTRLLKHMLRCKGGTYSYRGVRTYFPKVALNLRNVLSSVLQAVSCWSDSYAAVAPALFLGQWLSRLEETQWCLSMVLPDTCGQIILEYAGMREVYRLVAYVREYEPIIDVLMYRRKEPLIEQSKEFVHWIDSHDRWVL